MSALQSEFIEKDNIIAQHLGQKGLDINRKGKGGMALGPLKEILKSSKSIEHSRKGFWTSDLSDKVKYNVLRKLENLFLN